MTTTILKSLKYSEKAGSPGEWTLDDWQLGPVNLVVGLNATGKTRTLNVLWNLAKLFVSEPRYRPRCAGYDVVWASDDREFHYVLDIKNGQVEHEQLSVNGELLLDRRRGMVAQIFMQTENRMLQFRPPDEELAAARRDSLQHGFLAPLHEWALAVRHYAFGDKLGKSHFAASGNGASYADDRDAEAVVAIFRQATKEFPEFEALIRSDMGEMGYSLQEVLTCVPQGGNLAQASCSPELLALGVKEHGINDIVAQDCMSQGMFRTLSILIQVNYSQLSQRANCILIDDIGEGLDFERSAQLIQILQRKALQSNFQLVMTTNDRFVMNAVPLEYWSVLQRDGGHVRVRNIHNSREVFDEFQETGLSNFSFLEMDFLNGACEVAATIHA